MKSTKLKKSPFPFYFRPNVLSSFRPFTLSSVRPFVLSLSRASSTFVAVFLFFYFCPFVFSSVRTFLPSFRPSAFPCPSFLPSYLPTYLPTYLPSYLPTFLPSYLPTFLPSGLAVRGVKWGRHTYIRGSVATHMPFGCVCRHSRHMHSTCIAHPSLCTFTFTFLLSCFWSCFAAQVIARLSSSWALSGDTSLAPLAP